MGRNQFGVQANGCTKFLNRGIRVARKKKHETERVVCFGALRSEFRRFLKFSARGGKITPFQCLNSRLVDFVRFVRDLCCGLLREDRRSRNIERRYAEPSEPEQT